MRLGRARTSWGEWCCNGLWNTRQETKDVLMLEMYFIFLWLGGIWYSLGPPNHSAFLQHSAICKDAQDYVWTYPISERWEQLELQWGPEHIMGQDEAHHWALKLCSWYLYVYVCQESNTNHCLQVCFLCCSCTGSPVQTHNTWDLFCKPFSDTWLSALI